jgi:capsid protein
MPQAAYKFTDRRSSSGYISQSNSLIRSATQTTERKNIPMLDRDFHRNVSNLGRRTLMSISRYLFWNFPAIQGACLEQANLAVSSFIPQYYGRDKAGFGNEAENWLFEWHKNMDLEGAPYDYDNLIQHLIIADLVDGDIGLYLTESPEEAGKPLVQVIPGHLIGSRNHQNVVIGGEHDGATIIDGIIVDSYTRPIAARIYRDDNFASHEFTDVSFRNLILNFWPLVRGQKRGIPSLVSAIFDWQDVQESRQFELVAQKVAAAIYLLENNETGDIDESKAVMGSLATYDDTGAKTANATEKLTGEIRRFRAGSGSKIEAFRSDRPTSNQQMFEDRIVRSAFCGMEWSFDFCLDPSNVGGAPMRVIVDKINRTIEKRQKMVGKVCRRFDGYALSKAIERKEVRPDPDWYMWEYQPPARLTADAKYESDIDIQEVRFGLKTRKEACGRRGTYWEDVDAQRLAEVRADLTRAKDLAKEFDISIQEAIVLLNPPTPNGNLPMPPPEETEAPPHAAAA